MVLVIGLTIDLILFFQMHVLSLFLSGWFPLADNCSLTYNISACGIIIVCVLALLQLSVLSVLGNLSSQREMPRDLMSRACMM